MTTVRVLCWDNLSVFGQNKLSQQSTPNSCRNWEPEWESEQKPEWEPERKPKWESEQELEWKPERDSEWEPGVI